MSDWYRDEERRRQDNEQMRRNTERNAEAHRSDSDYWWNPTNGFWARMRKQDEYNDWLREQNAQAMEGLIERQREMAEQIEHQRREEARAPHDHLFGQEATSRHDELVDYAEAYHGRFSEDSALRSLWERAAEGKEQFAEARGSFWELINHDSSAEAERVRRILEAAGYELQEGERAARLRMEEYELTREQDEHRRNHDLTLSIDHIVAQSNREHGERLALDADNLRFMLLRDNVYRGDRYDEHDRSLREQREDLTRNQREFRERIDSMLDHDF